MAQPVRWAAARTWSLDCASWEAELSPWAGGASLELSLPNSTLWDLWMLIFCSGSGSLWLSGTSLSGLAGRGAVAFPVLPEKQHWRAEVLAQAVELAANLRAGEQGGLPWGASVSCCFLPVFADQLPGAGTGSDWSCPVPNIWSMPCCSALPSRVGFLRISTSKVLAEVSWAAVPCLLTVDFLRTRVRV